MVAGRRRARKRGYGSTRDVVMFLAPGMLCYTFMMLYPNIASIWYSLTDWTGYGSPRYVGLANFVQMVQDPALSSALAMALRSLVSVFVTLPLALGISFLLSRRVRGERVFRFFYFLPLVIPGMQLAVMWKSIFVQQGVLNFALRSIGLKDLALPWLSSLTLTPWTVLIPGVWGGACFYILIYVAALKDVPRELYDAAAIDGASAWQELVHVTLPSIRPVCVGSMILALPGALSTFIYPYVLTRGGPLRVTYTLSLWVFNNIYSSQGASDVPQIGYGSAIALLHGVMGMTLGLLVWRLGRRDWTAG
jgi:ABC-type sugar transport system permease subunit